MPAHDDAAFPVLAQAMIWRRFSRALTTPTELARSFSDPVALRPSSFRNRVRTPRWRASGAAAVSGVHPTARAGSAASARMGSNSRYLQCDCSAAPASRRRVSRRAMAA